MENKLVTFCYRKIIDKNSTRNWDKLVYDDSYTEFKMQAQNFTQNNSYTSFGQLKHHVAGAEKLHGLVSPSIFGYVQQLNGLVPNIGNNLGQRFLRFENFRFEIINSDIRDAGQHQVAINFFSEPMLWLETIDRYLLLAEAEPKADFYTTHLLELQPYLSIHTFKKSE